MKDSEDSEYLMELAQRAWQVRKSARILGSTAVGCVVVTATGAIYDGCNVEHRFRSHDIHAEVNAISTMVSAGDRDLTRLVVAADRKQFTPCGSCMDWVFEFGGPDCLVSWQRIPSGEIWSRSAAELMPFYPY